MHMRSVIILLSVCFAISPLSAQVDLQVSSHPDKLHASIASHLTQHPTVPFDIHWEIEMDQQSDLRFTSWEASMELLLVRKPMQLAGGSLLSDQRFSAILSSAFDLRAPDNTQITLPRITHDSGHFGWMLSYVTTKLGMHLFVMQDPAVIAGMLAEYVLTRGTIRVATLGCSGPLRKREGDYQAQRAVQAKLFCGMYQSVPVPIGNIGALQISLLLRSVVDDYLGDGLSIVGKMEFCGKYLSGSYQRLSIPAYPGAILTSAYTTEDQPMKREMITVHYQRENIQARISCTDSWWRVTVYAEDVQRRIVSARAHLRYAFLQQFSAGISSYYQRRWNRSGNIGNTVSISIPLSFTVGSVAVQITPEAIWGVSFRYRLESVCTFSIDDQRELAISWKFAHAAVDAQITYTDTFAAGKLAVTMKSNQAITFWYAISL